MPHLDAKALETDPDGMEFLRAVLRPEPKEPGKAGRRPRRKAPDRGGSRGEGANRPA